jgi:hypothetical protein
MGEESERSVEVSKRKEKSGLVLRVVSEMKPDQVDAERL